MSIDTENIIFSDNIIDSCQGIEPPPFSYCSNVQAPFSEIAKVKDKTKNKCSRMIMTKKQKAFDSTKERDSIEEPHEEEQKINSHNKFVNAFKYVRVFIQKLKFMLIYNNYKNLQKDHLRIIGDVSVFKGLKEKEESFYKSGFFKKIERITISLFQKTNIKLIFPVISRNNRILLIWDIIILLISIFYIIWTPISFSFEHQIEENLNEVEKIAKIFFVFDVLFKFNVTYHDHGNEIKLRKKIIVNYLKSGFIFDFFTLIGIYSDPFSFSKLMVFFKIISVSHYIDLLRELLIFSDFEEAIIKIMILISKILYIAHIFACLLNLISAQLIKNHDSTTSWIVEANLINRPWIERYFNAFYWAITTLTTVGYGDIVPKNNIEKLFCIIVMFTGSGIFAFTINKLSNIFGDISKKEREYLKNLRILNQMMKRKKLNSELQNKVRNYFHYMYKKENKQEIEEENQLFEKLSKGLQKEIILNSYASVLKQSDFLCTNFSEEFLKNIVFKMKQKICMPDESIFVEGQIDDKMYFLTQGKAQVYFDNKSKDNNEKIIYSIEAGETLCEINLITKEEYKYCCKSTEFSTFYTLSLKDFFQSLSHFPEDKEKYHMIKDSILLNNNYDYFYKKCKLCQCSFHLTEKCNFITYQPHQQKILYKLLLENRIGFNEREAFFRRSTKFNRYYCSDLTSSIKEKTIIYSSHRFASHRPEISSEYNDLKIMETSNEEKLVLYSPNDYHEYKDYQEDDKGDYGFLKNSICSMDLSVKNLHENNDADIFDGNIENNTNKLYKQVSRQIVPYADIKKIKNKKINASAAEPLFNFAFETWKNFTSYFPYNNFNSLMRKYRFTKSFKEELEQFNQISKKKTLFKSPRKLFKANHFD